MNCPLCKSTQLQAGYRVRGIPVFQNKVYETVGAAERAVTGNIALTDCKQCGFLFNADFDADLMDYDTHYDNEQAHSSTFRSHLDEIIDLFRKNGFDRSAVVEIGCGQGFFLEKLHRHHFDVRGFDPSYTGGNPLITRDYFTQKYSGLKADLVVLRHVLEHIRNPRDFLKTISKAVDRSSKIYIEVPDADWIFKRRSFWDIAFEHCNYFNTMSLNSLFKHSATGRVFNGQYLYLIAKLEDLDRRRKAEDGGADMRTGELEAYVDACKRYVRKNAGLFIWGAGAKGSIFANLTDPARQFIAGVIDINPWKQGRFVGKTGHRIVSPEVLEQEKIDRILIMNENYYSEIRQIVNGRVDNLEVLGVDI